jgi:hypothetical protein
MNSIFTEQILNENIKQIKFYFLKYFVQSGTCIGALHVFWMNEYCSMLLQNILKHRTSIIKTDMFLSTEWEEMIEIKISSLVIW